MWLDSSPCEKPCCDSGAGSKLAGWQAPLGVACCVVTIMPQSAVRGMLSCHCAHVWPQHHRAAFATSRPLGLTILAASLAASGSVTSFACAGYGCRRRWPWGICGRHTSSAVQVCCQHSGVWRFVASTSHCHRWTPRQIWSGGALQGGGSGKAPAGGGAAAGAAWEHRAADVDRAIVAALHSCSTSGLVISMYMTPVYVELSHFLVLHTLFSSTRV